MIQKQTQHAQQLVNTALALAKRVGKYNARAVYTFDTEGAEGLVGRPVHDMSVFDSRNLHGIIWALRQELRGLQDTIDRLEDPQAHAERMRQRMPYAKS